MRDVRSARFVGFALFVFSSLLSVPAFAQLDFSGQWAVRYHEDFEERSPGGELGDYTGLPLNDAARLRADSWDAGLYGLDEWQCRPHSSMYMWRSVHPFRIWKDVEPVTGETIALHVNFQDEIERVVYLDGRPHPPEEAPHTWSGFSTGKWEGDMLTVETTHLKPAYVRRDGLARSEKGTLREHFIRNGNVLTWISIVTDPVYLTKPYIKSRNFYADPGVAIPDYPCSKAIEIPRAEGAIPHYLPGTNPSLTEWAAKNHLPAEAARGGAETMYPEYMLKLNTLPSAKVQDDTKGKKP
jgi:hypothetical protein